MVKRILIFAMTFAIALGGATALVVARTKPVEAAAKPSAVDTTATPRDSAAAHDSVAAADSMKSAKDTTAATPARAAAMPARDTTRAPSAALTAAIRAVPRDSLKPLAVAPPVMPVAAAPAQTGPVTPLLAGGRLSKIFGAMSARDAAKVLEQMDDADVKQILARLNDKKAAEILALLPAARAAIISKAALTNPGTAK
jgi:hypothetical protein